MASGSHTTAWLPNGRYMIPIVDGLDAYWARTSRTPGMADIHPPTNVRGVPIKPRMAAFVAERLVANPNAALQNHGRCTGRCGACGESITGRTRSLGAHRGCLLDLKNGFPQRRAQQQATRTRLTAEVAAAWRAAPHDRRARALAGAGPTTMGKLDATADRAERGLSAVGMAMPERVIDDRADPRIPAWADVLAARLTGLTAGQFAAAFYWVGWEVMRHMTADLATGGVVRWQAVRAATMGQARAQLGKTAMRGRILHADLSTQPGLALTVTVLDDDVPHHGR